MKFLQTLRRWAGIISKSINWLKTSYKKHPEFYLVLIFIGLFIIFNASSLILILAGFPEFFNFGEQFI